MTIYDYVKQVSGLKKHKSIHKLCNKCKWYCCYYNVELSELVVKKCMGEYKNMNLSYYNSEYHVGYEQTRKTDCDGTPLYKFYIFKATGFDKYDTVKIEYRYTWNIKDTIYNIMQKFI